MAPVTSKDLGISGEINEGKALRTIARTSFALVAMLAAVWKANAQDSKHTLSDNGVA